MEGFELIQDLFENEHLASIYKKAATTNRKLATRPLLDLDEPEDVVEPVNTQELEELFHKRFGLFYELLLDGKVDILDFYKERAILDILELNRAGCMPASTIVLDQRYEDFMHGLRKKYLEEDKKILDNLESIEGPVESEEQMDDILRAMLEYKAYRKGRGDLKHYTFILKQCFYNNSALMKNKEKYEEIIYRALEGFAKEEQIKALNKLEKRLRKNLASGVNLKKKDELFKRNKGWIRKDLRELIRNGWSFDNKTLEAVADYLEKAPLDKAEKRNMMSWFAKAESKGEYDNSPIIIIDRLRTTEKGKAQKTLVSIDRDHIRQMVYGGVYAKLGVINTIYHENVHVRQNREAGNPNTLSRYLQLKLDLLIERDEDEDLYDKIYDSSELSELEAHANAAMQTVQFIRENGIDVDPEPVEKQMMEYQLKIQELLNRSMPLIDDFGRPVKEKISLSDALEDIIIADVRDCSREQLVADFGEDADEIMEELILKSALPKYKKDKTKPFAIEDYQKNNNILKDYPILRIEYGDDGKRRDMGGFLRNAKELLTNFRFLNSSKKVAFVVDKDIKSLIESIFVQEFMKPENLPELLYQLSKDDLGYDAGASYSLYKGMIKDFTEELGMVFLKASSEMEKMPRETLVNSVLMCQMIQGFIDNESKEEKIKRRDFFAGLFAVEPGSGESTYSVMKEFEEKAIEFLGKDAKELLLEEKKKKGKRKEGISFDD